MAGHGGAGGGKGLPVGGFNFGLDGSLLGGGGVMGMGVGSDPTLENGMVPGSPQGLVVPRLTPAEIQTKIEERNEARRLGRYADADAIRATLYNQGVQLMDDPGARGRGVEVTEWRYFDLFSTPKKQRATGTIGPITTRTGGIMDGVGGGLGLGSNLNDTTTIMGVVDNNATSSTDHALANFVSVGSAPASTMEQEPFMTLNLGALEPTTVPGSVDPSPSQSPSGNNKKTSASTPSSPSRKRERFMDAPGSERLGPRPFNYGMMM